jgi:hypothetical protein
MARAIQRERLDLDAHDLNLSAVSQTSGRARQTWSSGLSVPRFSTQWLSPRRRFVRAGENRHASLTGLHMTMDRSRFTNVSEVLWQGSDRWACQVDRRTGHGAILPRGSSARAATAEHT